MRQFPLEVVVAESKKVTQRIVFHPDQLRHQVKRQRCFCGNVSNDRMLLCDTCQEWYHCDCIGVTKKEAATLQGWKCGYCFEPPDAAGDCVWKMDIPQGKRKKAKVAPSRNVSQTPRELGIDPEGADLVWEGPDTWDKIVDLAREGGRKINLEQKRHKAAAAKILKEGGHHIVDEMTAGGVQARGVSNALADEFYHNDMLNDALQDAAEGDE